MQFAAAESRCEKYPIYPWVQIYFRTIAGGNEILICGGDIEERLSNHFYQGNFVV
jgi:hypothetical protein